jgi:phosphoribosylglycinamide formyltransferase-1
MDMTDMIADEEMRAGSSTMRIAYFLSTRELAGEHIADPQTDADANAAHRGNLPAFAAAVRNGQVEGASLSLIVMDDDRPLRDFSDLGLKMHLEPSSAFRRLGRNHPERPAAKAAYERRLLDVLRGYSIDLVVCDRYMIIHGPLMLEQYGGLIINSHPARLPDLRGATPTLDALRRAREEGIMFTGNTLHIIDEKIDTGPVIRQIENTHIFPQDQHWDLRGRNYLNESWNMIAGVGEYLSDPLVHRLIAINRTIERIRREGNGNTATLMAWAMRMRNGAHLGLRSVYEASFQKSEAHFQERLRQERTDPTLRPTLRGDYVYSAQSGLPLPKAFRRIEARHGRAMASAQAYGCGNCKGE